MTQETKSKQELDANGWLFYAWAQPEMPLEKIGPSLYPDGMGGNDYDDLTDPVVTVVSKIGYADRCRKYGVRGLPLSNYAGVPCGPQGDPIPTEDWIEKRVRAYGDTPEIRRVTLHPYRKMSVTQAMNRAGQDLRELLDSGDYVIKENG